MVDRFGAYEVTGVLGKGALGTVYSARHPQHGDQVAVKTLSQTSETHRRRFQREYAALAKLEHPHVITVLEAGEKRGTPWFAMRRIEGGNLEEYLRRSGRLSVEAVHLLAAQLCSSLSAAHALEIVHRDLKPDNVLVRGVDDYVVTDFGLAKDLTLGESQQLTKSGILQGTPGYWAPEQACGQGKTATVATDVYGVGAVLYAALTGGPPFRGAGVMEIVAATVSEPPQPLRELRADVPSALEAVVLRCLAKDPGERYASIAELGQALVAASSDAVRSRSVAGTLLGWVALGACAALLFAALRPAAHSTSRSQTPDTAPKPLASPEPMSEPAERAVEVLWATEGAAAPQPLQQRERDPFPAAPRVDPNPDALFRFSVGRSSMDQRCGFLNARGEVVIPPTTFLEAQDFAEGLAAVRVAYERWGFIDRQGTLVIPTKFQRVYAFSEGLSRAQRKRGEGFGYIDRQGEWVIEPIPKRGREEVRDFSEGLAAARIGELWGYYGRSGEVAIEPVYARCGSFQNGVAWVELPRGRGQVLINPSGEQVSPVLELIRRWQGSEGFIPAARNGRWGCLTEAGSWAFEPTFENAPGPCREGRMSIKVGERYGYIDTEGRVVIEPRFQEARPFSDGLAAVRVSQRDEHDRARWAYVDREGKIAIAAHFGRVSDFSEGLAWVSTSWESPGDSLLEGQYSFIDKSGKTVIPGLRYTQVGVFKNGLVRIGGGGNGAATSFLDQRGRFVGPELKTPSTPGGPAGSPEFPAPR